MNVNAFMNDWLDGRRAMNNKVAESQSIAEQLEDEEFKRQAGNAIDEDELEDDLMDDEGFDELTEEEEEGYSERYYQLYHQD